MPENDGTEIEERVSNLENVSQLSLRLLRIMEENVRSLEQEQRRVREQQQRRDEVMQQLIQAVAVMQADIVRIDETHS